MLTLLSGDCREEMKWLAADSIDSRVTDPPYELVSSSKDKRDPRRASPSEAQRKKIGGFMNLQWDATGVAFDVEVWKEVLRVLKPGAHLLAFGGTRTAHRMAVAIEDAGFEIRDSIHWMYGSGFPKSRDISKAIDKAAGAERDIIGIKPGHEGFANRGNVSSVQSFKETGGGGYARPWMDDPEKIERYHQATAPATDLARLWAGWGTALKPAHEIIYLCRKPISESSIAANVLRWGTGALNIDGSRIGANHWTKKDGANSGSNGGHLQQIAKREAGVTRESSQGRWPANVVLSHSPLCERVGEQRIKACGIGSVKRRPNKAGKVYSDDQRQPGTEMLNYADADGLETVAAYRCHNSCPVAELDRQSGDTGNGYRRNPSAVDLSDAVIGYSGKAIRGERGHDDSGGASRFYFTAEWSEDDFIPLFYYVAKASRNERDAGLGNLDTSTMNRVNKGGLENDPRWEPIEVKNAHPTVKPVTLMAYLCKLITPPGGVILDPFAGSGTTGRAAMNSGFKAILIEQDEAWLEVINARCATQLGLPL